MEASQYDDDIEFIKFLAPPLPPRVDVPASQLYSAGTSDDRESAMASTATVVAPSRSISDVETILNHLNIPGAMDAYLTSIGRFSMSSDFNTLAPAPTTRARNKRGPDEGPGHKHLDYTRAPMTSIYDVAKNMGAIAKEQKFEKACEGLRSRPLRIMTACSGTEAPLIALGLIQDAMFPDGNSPLQIHHVASAEIEKFKAAYIERNFSPDVIYRDVTEWQDSTNPPHTIYGAQHELPTDVDILIAGSACVDYSPMSSAPKQFGEKGESYSTMQGISAYVRRHRPTILILENVKNAPWDKISDYWRTQDYEVICFYVDSKNFGVPQTRHRGYMFAVDQKQAEQAGRNTKEMCFAFRQFVAGFQMRASAPYTDWIYSADDFKLALSKKVFENTLQPPNRSMGWETCAARHMSTRSGLRLGQGRPVTWWKENGGCRALDFIWQHWVKNQRERIWDTMDINFLRYLVKFGFDMTFKSRAIDISQNVDRDKDTRAWGLLMCQTPSGMPFETMRCGPITGRESAIIQGIPVDDLILTYESTTELQSLSGNAMTTSIAGPMLTSAILVAGLENGVLKPLFKQHSAEKLQNLMAGSRNLALSKKRSRQTVTSVEVILARWKANDLECLRRPLKAQKPKDLVEIVDNAIRSLRLCSCEGSAGQVTRPFVICKICGHTACSACKHNPGHDYTDFDGYLGQRILPTAFVDTIKNTLPRYLSLASEGCEEIVEELQPFKETETTNTVEANPATPWLIPGGRKENEEYRSLVRNVLKSTFLFRTVKRDTAHKIEYSSDEGTLELHLTPYFAAAPERSEQPWQLRLELRWVLFAHCVATTPSGSELREVLKYPVATMEPSASILQGTWMIRDPAKDDFKATITRYGSAVNAWESSLGITDPRFIDIKIYTKLQVDLSNYASTLPEDLPSVIDFTLHLDCGAPQGSLYRSISTVGDKKRHLFCFLDPHPLRDANEDSFVLSFDCTRKTAHSKRSALVQFQKGWRATLRKEDARSGIIDCAVVDKWHDARSVMLCEPSEEAKYFVPSAPTEISYHTEACRNADFVVLGVEIPFPKKLQAHFETDARYEIDLVDRRGKLKPFGWMLEGTEIPEHAKTGSKIIFTISSSCLCETCVPNLPAYIWEWARRRKSQKLNLRPFASAKLSAQHELQLRDRAQAAEATLDCHTDAAYFELRLNLETMTHRVIAPLVAGNISREAEVRWCIVPYDPLQAVPVFDKVELRNNDMNDTGGRLVMNDKEDEYDISVDSGQFGRNLSTTQARTLTWMISQDTQGFDWKECHKIDSRIAPLGWSIEVEATVKKIICGGVLADEVGSGKTVTLLALVHHYLNNPKSYADAPSTADGKILIAEDRIKLDASLILVPKNILLQWEDQIKACFGKTPGWLVKIFDIATLKRKTWQDFKSAKIILASWDILEHLEYWRALRDLCAAPNVPTTGGRALRDWMRETLDGVGELVTDCAECEDEDDIDDAFQTRRDKLAEKLDRFDQFQPFKQKQSDEFKEVVAPNAPAAPGEVASTCPKPTQIEVSKEHYDILKEWDSNWKRWPLFHFFSFSHVIADEFTYWNSRTILGFLTLETRSRWLLSGTPPIGTLDGIDATARLLGTKVIADAVREVPFGFGGKAKPPQKLNEQTYAEEQLSFSESTSPACQQSQLDTAKRFAKEFIRQNFNPAVKRHTVHHHHMVFAPSAMERVTWFEFYQLLCNQSMKFSQTAKKYKLDGSSRSEDIKKAIQQSSSAEHALLCCNVALSKRNSAENGDPNNVCFNLRTTLGEELQAIFADFYSLMGITFYYAMHEAKRMKKPAKDHLSKYLRSFMGRGDYGDAEVTDALDKLMTAAWEHQDTFADYALRPWTGKVNDFLAAYQNEVDARNTIISQINGFSNQVLDQNARAKIDDLTTQLEVLAFPPQDEKPRTEYVEVKTRVTSSFMMTRNAVTSVRSARFYKAVDKVIKGKQISCSVCVKRRTDPSQFKVSASCGHVICNDCMERPAEALDDTSAESPPSPEDDSTDDNDGDEQSASKESSCLVDGCTAAFVGDQLVHLNRFAKDEVAEPAQHGSRNAAIIQVIQELKDKYILIFVQYDSMKDHLIDALKAAGIAYADGFTGAKDTVKNFKEGAIWANIQINENYEFEGKRPLQCPYASKNSVQPRVLIMKLDSVDSAGW